jgi:sulfide:quinone oxidoreductase
MSEAKTILVLGGGIGGIVAATQLRKKLPSKHRVVLIERESDHVFSPSLLWLMTGQRTAEKISRPLANLEKHGIELVRGEIRKIDPDSRSIVVGDNELSGDYLIVALGAELNPQAIPGLAEAGYNLYSLEGAKALCDDRLKFKNGKIIVLVSSMPFKCPAAPYESVMLLESDFRKRGLRDQVTFELYSPEPGPMGVAGPEVSKQVRQMVESRDVTYFPEHTLNQVDPDNKRLTFSNGVTVDFDLLVYIAPHQAPKVATDAGLVGESGWVPVDRGTLETKFPGVYAIGDVTGIMLAIGKPLPKAGVFAHGEAEVVANNIVHDITGNGTPKSFSGNGECFIEIGDGKAGFGSGNFFAEPNPQIKLRQPSRLLHLGKVAFEKFWLYRWF